MRKTFQRQRRFGCRAVENIERNLNCRDEMIPVLAALQHVYSQPQLRGEFLALVAADANRDLRDDCGREGLSYWQILVLAAVRLGCNFDYDRLQNLAEEHRTLRMIMGSGDWDDGTNFGWRRIRDNVCLLKPETIERISQQIVGEGHRLVPHAAETTRADSFVADSFVIETDIHYPTESSLIDDGIRKVTELALPLARRHGLCGRRQHAHLRTRVKRTARQIARIASRKGAKYLVRLKSAYQKLLKLATKIIARSREMCGKLSGSDVETMARISEITTFIQRSERVNQTARRRVIDGETVPNEEKLFSIFEPHTQLYKRASFDRGFHSPENQTALAEIVAHPCLPKPGAKQSAAQDANATLQFRQARQSHPGIESAIGALQSGNGLQRCRDESELGFERYLALGILGRNLHVLGRLVIAKRNALCAAAKSLRRSPSAA